MTSRIEEIKERASAREYVRDFINLNGDSKEWVTGQEDIEYMLSVLNHPQEFWQLYDRFETKIQEKLLLKDKLEIAEKALEAAKEQLDLDDHQHFNGENWVKHIETTEGYKQVVEALKAIRE